MSSGLTAPNEAAQRLRGRLLAAGLLTHYDLLDAALRTERLRVVEQVREKVDVITLGKGWERIHPEALRIILDEVAGLSGEEPSDG